MKADDNIKRAAMFLVGFTMLAPLRLVVACAKFSIKRFQLPVERVGLFVNIIQNPMELAGFFSVLIGNIIIWLSKGKDKDKGKNNVPKIGSLFTNWLMFVMSIMSLVAYTSGGDSGNLKFYFWTMVFYTFIYKINYIFSVKVDVENVSYIYVGRPLFSIFVSVYHNLFLYFANKYEMNNIDYWIVYGQMVIMIIFTCASALLWTYSTYSEEFATFISCLKSKFGAGSQTQTSSSTSSPQPQTQNNQEELSSTCCCCCENCKKGESCSCGTETTQCNFCKVAKLICCLCKNGTQCTSCVQNLSSAIEQLSNYLNGDSLKCTCSCIEKIDCCRIKRFIEFYEALCCYLKNAKCFCKSIVKVVRAITCYRVEENGHICIYYRWCHRTVVERCECCNETNSCLKKGKCNLVNVLEYILCGATGTCGTRDGNLCNCVLTVFSKVKCKLLTKVCGKCCPCIANNECNSNNCKCALCWRRFFRCYIICGEKCKQADDQCKCCCVGEGSKTSQCTCCSAPSQPSVQCSFSEEETECKCHCCTSSQSSNTEAQQNGKSNEKRIWDELKKPLLWSPAMIVIFSNGTMYSVYPGVSPYQLVSTDVGYKIGLINLILSPIIPIIICILDLENIKKGPSKEWKGQNRGWHAIWAGPIYAIICIILFFYTLHYPESMIGRNIYGNDILVGLLTVSYVMVQEGLKAVGPSATKSQVQNEQHKGTIPPIMYLISLVLSNASGFIGDGYLRTFRRYSRDNWPTRGYTRYRGFKFWLGSACKVAGNSILNAFNSDIRARIESFS